MKKCTLLTLFEYSKLEIISLPDRVLILGHEFVKKELFDDNTTKKYIDYQRVDKSEEYAFKTYLISMPYLAVTYKREDLNEKES